jgi:hypothetical protein
MARFEKDKSVLSKSFRIARKGELAQIEKKI